MKSPHFGTTIREELFSFQSLLSSGSIAVLYIVLSVTLLNYQLIADTFIHDFPLIAKVSIFFALLQGAWTGMTRIDFVFLLINSMLVGVNLTLVIKTVYQLGHQGKVHLSIGGATLLSIVTTGCASCGLSVLSLLGLSASLSFLPFRGLELHILATGILLFSSWYMLRQLYNAKYCKIK